MNLAIVNASSYDENIIDSAVGELLDQLGGLEKFVPQGSNVFIKVNLVRDMSPEKCGTTHPSVARALATRLTALGCKVVVGDSSGGAYTKNYMSNVYRVTRMDSLSNIENVSLNSDFDYHTAAIDGKLLKSVDLTNSFLNADVVINVGKLKTHSFTGYTGCVKNLFGLIPGLVKVEMHSKFPNINEFLDLLIDLEQFASKKIVLNVLDAVIGMDGEGPTNGHPKFMGKLIASPNAYLCDVAGVSLFANPLEMPLLAKAVERGVLSKDFSETDFDFDSLKKDFIADFRKVDVIPANFLKMPRWLRKLMKVALCPKVVPNRKLCRGCGKCRDHCPAKAIMLIDRKARVNQNKCIRCYCCQELCPFNAITLVKPLPYKVVRGLSHTKSKKQ